MSQVWNRHHHPCTQDLNDYRPVVLMTVIMECFERLVLAQIKATASDLDQHQFAYKANRPTDCTPTHSSKTF